MNSHIVELGPGADAAPRVLEIGQMSTWLLADDDPRIVVRAREFLYHRFSLSFRDVEDLLAHRGIVVSYETIRRWCHRFGPIYARNHRITGYERPDLHYL